jgi:hypothetical protein
MKAFEHVRLEGVRGLREESSHPCMSAIYDAGMGPAA